MKSIGERIKLIRKELGLNQTDFAKELNLSRSRVGYIENGDRSLTERTLNDMVREYGVNKDYVLTGIGDMFIDISASEEIINYIRDLCKDDPEKADLILDVYTLFNKLDEDEQNVIRDLIKVMVEKKHPKE